MTDRRQMADIPSSPIPSGGLTEISVTKLQMDVASCDLWSKKQPPAILGREAGTVVWLHSDFVPPTVF